MAKVNKIPKRHHRAKADAWVVVDCARCRRAVRVLRSDGIAVVREILRDCPNHFVARDTEASHALMKFFRRQLFVAMLEATRVAGMCSFADALVSDAAIRAWDEAIMARDWFARPRPDAKVDRHGWLMSFETAVEVLGGDVDYERTYALEKIDAAADFDSDEVYARIDYLTANPPDDVDEEMFPDAPRVVVALDQGQLFGMFAEAA